MMRVLGEPPFLFPDQLLWLWNHNSDWKSEGVRLTCGSSNCVDEINTECIWHNYVSWRSGCDKKTKEGGKKGHVYKHDTSLCIPCSLMTMPAPDSGLISLPVYTRTGEGGSTELFNFQLGRGFALSLPLVLSSELRMSRHLSPLLSCL